MKKFQDPDLYPNVFLKQFRKEASDQDIYEVIRHLNNPAGLKQVVALFPTMTFFLFARLESILQHYHRQYPERSFDSPLLDALNTTLNPLYSLLVKDPLSYLVRIPDWGKHQYGGADFQLQRKYGEFQAKTHLIGILSYVILNWDYQQLLDFYARRRAEIALKNGHVHSLTENIDYGMPRTSFSTTILWSRYAALGKYFIKLVKLTGPDQVRSYPFLGGQIEVLITKNEAYLFRGLPISHYANEQVSIRRVFHYQGQSFPLDRVVINFEATHCNQLFIRGKTCVCIAHTETTDFPQLLNLGKTLFLQAKELSGDKLIEACGYYFWWICLVKPWKLGDPSIAELMFKTQLALHGYHVPAWKEGIIPWAEATKALNPNAFAADFKTLFDGEIYRLSTHARNTNSMFNGSVNWPSVTGNIPLAKL